MKSRVSWGEGVLSKHSSECLVDVFAVKADITTTW